MVLWGIKCIMDKQETSLYYQIIDWWDHRKTLNELIRRE